MNQPNQVMRDIRAFERWVASLTAMKTLPRNETMIDTRFMDGEDIAAEIAANRKGLEL